MKLKPKDLEELIRPPPVIESPFRVDTTTPEFPPRPVEPAAITMSDRADLVAVLAEIAARRKEALRVYTPWSKPEAFHRCNAGIRLARGSNRAGKTLATCVEIARAVTNQDPHHKYPKKGRVILVGKDLLHISKVLYRKLFKPGAFQIVKDLDTNEWRPFRPWSEPTHPEHHGIRGDAGRESEREDAPPLISRRWYNEKEMSWENKKEEIFRSVTLNTGWEMTAFSGEGKPPQGWDVDIVVFDEEIPHPAWYNEMVPRLVDRNGKFIWSFTPQAGTIQAYELQQRSEDEIGEEDPRVVDFHMTISDNPYLSQSSKDKFESDLLADEEEHRVRFKGDFAIQGMRIYPTFNSKGGSHKVASFEVPEDWTRYLAIDPGRQVSACLLLAVPPPRSNYDRPIVCGETYTKKTDVRRAAKEIKDLLGMHWVHGWLIDHHHGRKHDMSGETIEEQYAKAFRELHMDTENGFKGFIWANDDVAAGKIAGRAKLAIYDGAPVWQFMVDRLPWFCWEIERYVDRRITKSGNVIDDVSPSNLHNHLMDCFRYLASHHCSYVTPPRKNKLKKGWTTVYLEKKRKREAERNGWDGSIRLG